MKHQGQKIIEDALVGAFSTIAKRIAITCVLFYFTISAVGYFSGEYAYDDTDKNGKRSGMLLRTDYGTGCQYLETSSGAITPRMDGEKHMGCNK